MSTMSRVLPWALLVSLAVNLFLAGAIVSHGWMHQPGERQHESRRMGQHGMLPHPRHLRRVLSDAGRERFDALHEAHKPAIRERLQAVGAARKALGEVLRAEPLDRAQMDAAFAALREQEALLAQEMQSMFGELASQLSAEDRAAIAQRIPGPRGPRPPKD